MLIHKTALTEGITKNGEIKSTRTIPRPGKVRFINIEIANPKITVRIIMLPTIRRLFCTANQKSFDLYKTYS